jgi:hypothetical protein
MWVHGTAGFLDTKWHIPPPHSVQPESSRFGRDCSVVYEVARIMISMENGRKPSRPVLVETLLPIPF